MSFYFYFYQILTAFTQVEDYVRGCSTSTKYWLPSTSWRLCQRLFYLYQILTAFNKLKIMSEVVLPLPNTDCLQQVEDYVRGCSTSTKYWLPSHKLKIMSEVVLLLPNTDCLHTSWRLCQRLFYLYQILTAFTQVEDYVRGCSTSTKYWLPSTSWRLCQRLFYLYQILTAFTQVEDYVRGCSTSTKYWLPSHKLKIMSEVVLPLPNTDCLHTSWRLCQRLFYLYQILTAFTQVEDYVRGCSTSTKYWLPSHKLKIMSEVVLLLPNTDCLHTSWRLCQRLFYFYQILTAFTQVEDYVRGCSTSTKYWLPSHKLKIMSEVVLPLPNTDCLHTSWRLCQRLFYFYQILTAFTQVEDYVRGCSTFYQILTAFTQVEDYVRGCSTSTKYWLPSHKLKIMSEVVLLLPNTDCLHTSWRLCQRLFYLYQILTAFTQVEDYVRGCSTSTKYWLPSHKLKIMSEVVLPLPNTDCLHTSWRLCQRLFYLYQILTAFTQVEDYVRGCSTSTKYWLPSHKLKIMSEVVLPLPNTDCLHTSWRLCQRLFYLYQILTAFTQVEDYVRGCSTSTKYWLPSHKLKIMSEVVLLLPNTDCLHTSWRLCQRLFYFYQILTAFTQVEDYVRGCSTSTKYWLPSHKLKIMSEVVLLLPNTDCLHTSWRLCQRLFYFYQILTAFTQVEDYVRGCSTSTKYWLPSHKLKIMSEVVLPLPNTDCLHTSWRLCQRLFYLYQILTAFTQVEDYVRGCSTSTKYWLPSHKLKIMSEVVLPLPNTDCLHTSWRLCQRLFYLYQILTAFTQVEDYVRGCSTSMSEVVLNTDCLHTSWRLCQRLFYLYQILTAFTQVEDYVRGCSTSTKYWLPSHKLKIMSEVVLPLPNTDCLHTSWRLCQRLFYFYQILTAFTQVEDYVRGCSTSTKYWLPSHKLKIMSEVVLPLPNTDCLHTSWRLCQRLFYFTQVEDYTIFTLLFYTSWQVESEVVLPLPNTDCLHTSLKIMSEVVHLYASLLYIMTSGASLRFSFIHHGKWSIFTLLFYTSWQVEHLYASLLYIMTSGASLRFSFIHHGKWSIFTLLFYTSWQVEHLYASLLYIMDKWSIFTLLFYTSWQVEHLYASLLYIMTSGASLRFSFIHHDKWSIFTLLFYTSWQVEHLYASLHFSFKTLSVQWL